MKQEEYEEVIRIVAQSHSIDEYEINKGDDKSIGKHYLGNLISIQIQESKPEKDDKINVKVLLKIPPNNEYLRQQGLVTAMYRNEIHVYTKLLPSFRQIDKDFEWPRCYHVREEVLKELLVLQDLRSEGYSCTGGMFFDFQHAVKAMEKLAQFHALSMAFEINRPTEFEEFSRVCCDLINNPNIAKTFVGLLSDSLKNAANLIKGDVGKLLEEYSINTISHLKDLVKISRIKSICHGDLWTSNIIFKYENDNPASACLLDYQAASYGSTAKDFLYLVASSTNSDLRQNHFEELFQIYHKQINHFLDRYCITTEKSCTIDDLRTDLKVVAPACVIRVTYSFSLWCGLMDASNNLFQETICEDVVVLENRRKQFVKIMTDLVEDFKKFELIV